MLDIDSVMQPMYRTLATRCRAAKQCNTDWAATHEESIEWLEENYLPHGSGFDSGCSVRIEESGPDKLVIDAPYHYMDDVGQYREWWDLVATITPSLDVNEFDAEVKVDGEPEMMDEMIAESSLMRLWDALRRDAPAQVERWREVPQLSYYDTHQNNRRLRQVAVALDMSAENLREAFMTLMVASDKGLDLDRTPLERDHSPRYCWRWSVGPDGAEWGVDIALSLSNYNLESNPYVVMQWEATSSCGDRVWSVSQGEYNIWDSYRISDGWDGMQERVGPLVEEVVDYIHNRKEE